MDETFEHDESTVQPTENDRTDSAPLMPLSMPPVRSSDPSPVSGTPAPAPGMSGEATPPFGSPPYDTGLMPLSMPPGGTGMPPPPPPYGSWYEGVTPPPPQPPRRTRKLVAVGVALALLVGGLGAGLGAAFGGSSSAPTSSLEAIPSTSTQPLTSTANAESRIYAAVEPAVVDINTKVASPSGEQEAAEGTGMIVTSNGEVLTNNHVIDEATSITVTIQHRTGPVNGQFNAKVIGFDSVHDVAVIKIEGVSNLPHISLGNSSSVVVGDTVYAIGNALGFGGAPSVQSGAITATSRTITAADQLSSTASETLHNLLQTNAQIQEGDSGGPLVNASGQVIGMDTAASSTDGTSNATDGFAIPINQARTIANNILNGKSGNGVTIGYAPFLGVELGTAGSSPNSFNFGNGFSFSFGNSGTSSPATTSGAVIEGVVTGSPAASAGLSAGDVITAIDGTKVTSDSAVKPIISAKRPGDSISVTYVDTNNASHTASLKLAEIPY